MLKKLKVRRGCAVQSPLTWPSTKKCDGREKFAPTRSVDGCRVLLETQYVESRLGMGTIQVLSVGCFLPLWRLPERDPVCRDPPRHGHHTGFICRGFPSPLEAARERPSISRPA